MLEAVPLHPKFNPRQKHCCATLAGHRGSPGAGGAEEDSTREAALDAPGAQRDSHYPGHNRGVRMVSFPSPFCLGSAALLNNPSPSQQAEGSSCSILPSSFRAVLVNRDLAELWLVQSMAMPLKQPSGANPLESLPLRDPRLTQSDELCRLPAQ